MNDEEKVAFVSGYTSSWATSQVWAMSQAGYIPSKDHIQNILAVGDKTCREILAAMGLEYPSEDKIKLVHEFAKELNQKCKDLNLGA